MSGTAKKAKKTRKAAAPPTAAQEAHRVTWRLKGDLKRAQRAYIRIGEQLVQVRDRKLFEALKHPDMEDYAAQRLGLGRSSLYKYIQVYDWVAKCHPEWLERKVKGFIPDLSDVAGLMWIDSELSRPDLDTNRRAALATLEKKGRNGRLSQKDITALRRQGKKSPSSLKSVLSKLRSIRKQSAALVDMPAEGLAHLDALIEILKNDHALQVAGIYDIGQFFAGSRGNILA